MFGLTPLDLGAITIFALAWLCYHAVLEWSPYGARNLNHVMDRYRHAWMRQMLSREVRIVDTQITASLQNGSAFFASSSLFAIGGALALLRSSADVQKLLVELPLAIDATQGTWELKSLGLTVMFVYAFFKFAWSYRLFNYAAIMMGSVPPAAYKDDPAALAMADRTAKVHIIAARHFNRGQRALFFALGYLGWFVNAWILLATTLAVLVVMLRRQHGPEFGDVFAGDPVAFK
ncbi:DUF599 domain-containing protein [Blastochloris viridis]|uniref:DUF599 family protein n=1 Tax=Blastochloris viridis TaxID=1079 RepID=A0A0H5BK39_BLAVI|nr:DUF599 family protein [Blastochloris viridis]ALK09217.1 hypothetical protein BVIR_1433 [Blastochloris viridis]BAS00917.1 hypothetical protein BV133_3323 [Blastochloris viridis]CUU41880.1 hypothetical protein BVIRIDIS_08780 [Blastochloris viridis]